MATRRINGDLSAVALVVLMVVAAAVVGGSSAARPLGLRSQKAACAWRDTTPPAITKLADANLFAVAVLSPSDAWVVGVESRDWPKRDRPLTLNWNGKAWRRVPAKSPDATLVAVAGLSARDVWAVGAAHFTAPDAVRTAIAMHWNGSRWRATKMPKDPRGGTSELSQVVALAHDDVWAVGSVEKNVGNQRWPLVERWTGEAWHIVRLPTGRGTANGVAASSQRLLWIAGGRDPPGRPTKAFALRSSGSTWISTKLPKTRYRANEVTAVIAWSPRSAWAFGQTNTFADERNTVASSFALRWNGRRWLTAPTPRQFDGSDINACSAGAGKLWAWTITRAEIAYWGGGSWHLGPQVPYAKRLSERSIADIAAISGGTFWLLASGYDAANDHWQHRILEYRCSPR